MDTSKDRARLIGFGVLLLASVLAPLHVLQLDGWPYNDESMAMFERIETFRRSFARGIFYPIWTTWAHSGYGSPWPLFYHRLYSVLGAILSWPAGSPLVAVKWLTVAILFFGAAGMRRLLLVTGATELLAVAAGLLFIFAPYTRTEWLARGAMAEFLAMAMLPWIYAEVALFLEGQRHWVRLGVWVALLFHAHSMICLLFLTSAVVLAVAMLLGYRQEVAWKGVEKEKRAILLAGAIVFVLVIPHAIVATMLMPYFNTRVMISEPFRIQDNFHPTMEYLADSWAANEDGLSLEINRYLLLGLLVLLIPAGRRERLRWQAGVPLIVFALVGCVFAFVLQRPESLPAYKLLWNSAFLQFPWRLLTFMTVGSIFLFVTGVRALQRESRARETLALGVLAAVVGLTALHFGTAESREKNVWSTIEISTVLEQLDGPLSAGEYQLKGMDKLQLINKRRPFVIAGGCSDRLRQTSALSEGEFALTTDLDEPCRISLRQFQTPLLDLQLSNAILQTEIPSEKYVIELRPGHSSVRLRQRNLWQALYWILDHHATLPKA